MQSRYYNPEWGRFINNDSIDVLKELETTNEVLTVANLYTYCGNNPVLNKDNDGNSWQLAFEGGTLPLDQPPHHTPSSKGHRSPIIWGK